MVFPGRTRPQYAGRTGSLHRIAESLPAYSGPAAVRTAAAADSDPDRAVELRELPDDALGRDDGFSDPQVPFRSDGLCGTNADRNAFLENQPPHDLDRGLARPTDRTERIGIGTIPVHAGIVHPAGGIARQRPALAREPQPRTNSGGTGRRLYHRIAADLVRLNLWRSQPINGPGPVERSAVTQRYRLL